MPQMYGLRSTFVTSSSRRPGFLAAGDAAVSSFFAGATISTGGYPTASGESRTTSRSNAPTTRPTAPGAHMPQRQPSARAAVPARTGAPKPPRLWAMFHMLQEKGEGGRGMPGRGSRSRRRSPLSPFSLTPNKSPAPWSQTRKSGCARSRARQSLAGRR